MVITRTSFNGDAVKLVTGGTVERDTADAAMTPIGVFLGCTYTDPYTGLSRYSASITQPAPLHLTSKAYVADGTDVLFKAAVLSSAGWRSAVIGDLAITDIGRKRSNDYPLLWITDILVIQRCGISDTSATTRHSAFADCGSFVEETKNSSGGFTEALVKWNAGHQLNNLTGV